MLKHCGALTRSEVLFRSCTVVVFSATNLTCQLVCIATVWLIHNLQSIKHLLLLESKFANNKFTFYFEKQSFPHLFELLRFKMLSIYYYDRKVNTNLCATSISRNVYETWFGQLQDFSQHFAGYIYIYIFYMVKLSKEQNNAQYNGLKIVKVTCKKTLFFSVLSLFSLPLLHVD